MKHMLKGENVGIAVGRQGQATGSENWDVVSIKARLWILTIIEEAVK